VVSSVQVDPIPTNFYAFLISSYSVHLFVLDLVTLIFGEHCGLNNDAKLILMYCKQR
jgi:hypothetical protein